MEVILFSYFTHTYTYLQHLLKVWTVGFCFVFLFFLVAFFFFPVSLSCCLDNWPRRSVHVHVIVINPDFNL